MDQVVDPELSAGILSPSSVLAATSVHDPDLIPASRIDAEFANCIDLLSARLNSRLLAVSDEFFAAAANLTSPNPPIRKPNTYVATGAWYDGWETRRHNARPYDHVVLRLGPAAGRVRGVEVDTAFFDGNHAPAVSVEGAFEPGDGSTGNESAAVDARVAADGYAGWFPLLGVRPCGPSARHAWRVHPIPSESADAQASPPQPPVVTHVRLRMYPDGGIARFRLYGSAVPAWPAAAAAGTAEPAVELSSALNGGRVMAFSDQHFGRAANVLLPGRGVDMGDGWETKRSRAPGHADWLVVRLGARGRLSRIVVDTMHFRGNFPRAVRVEACDVGEQSWAAEAETGDGAAGAEEGGGAAVAEGLVGLVREAVPRQAGADWFEAVKERPMTADEEAVLEGAELNGHDGRVISHVRLYMIPDGGVKRLRAFGIRV